jgi:hypothetical protein
MGGPWRAREEEAAEVREGPDNEAAAVVEATFFRARARAGGCGVCAVAQPLRTWHVSLHVRSRTCGVPAQGPLPFHAVALPGLSADKHVIARSRFAKLKSPSRAPMCVARAESCGMCASAQPFRTWHVSLHVLAVSQLRAPPRISGRGFLRPTCGSGGDADDELNSPMLPPESSRRGAQRPLKYWHVRYSAAASNMVCVCAWPCSVSA